MPRSFTETLVRLLGLYLILTGLAQSLHGLVLDWQMELDTGDPSGWLWGLGWLVVGGVVLAGSAPIATWAHCEEADHA